MPRFGHPRGSGSTRVDCFVPSPTGGLAVRLVSRFGVGILSLFADAVLNAPSGRGLELPALHLLPNVVKVFDDSSSTPRARVGSLGADTMSSHHVDLQSGWQCPPFRDEQVGVVLWQIDEVADAAACQIDAVDGGPRTCGSTESAYPLHDERQPAGRRQYRVSH